MDSFQAILAQVRALLSSRQLRRVRALLDSLREEELLSREYHGALLREPDAEALARKISLTLLEKGDLDSAPLGWTWTRLQAPAAARGSGCRDHGGEWHPCGSRGRGRWGQLKDFPFSEKEATGRNLGTPCQQERGVLRTQPVAGCWSRTAGYPPCAHPGGTW